jgi:hypothetical protein
MIRLIKKPQKLTMRIRPPRPHQHRPHIPPATQKPCKSTLHRKGDAIDVEIVRRRTVGDKGIDFGERVRRGNEASLDWEWGRVVIVQDVNVQKQEDEAIFSAIKG